jgi:hypothetical protein
MTVSASPHIVGVVFSRDRAIQLDAMLRSFFLNCADPELVSFKVIYAGKNAYFTDQYRRLRLEYATDPSIDFIEQHHFKKNVLRAIRTRLSVRERMLLKLGRGRIRLRASNKYLMFLVEDNVFIRPFRLSEVTSALDSHRDALGFALLLGTNINYCYPLDVPVVFPDHEAVSDSIVKYRWPDAGVGLNYPLEVSGSVYRINEIAPPLARLGYSSSNELEAQLALKASDYSRTHPTLLCYKHSITFCNPVNKSQNTYDKKAGTRPEYSTEYLARMFDDGYRIDIRGHQNMVPYSCHQEVKLSFSKEV